MNAIRCCFFFFALLPVPRTRDTRKWNFGFRFPEPCLRNVIPLNRRIRVIRNKKKKGIRAVHYCILSAIEFEPCTVHLLSIMFEKTYKSCLLVHLYRSSLRRSVRAYNPTEIYPFSSTGIIYLRRCAPCIIIIRVTIHEV